MMILWIMLIAFILLIIVRSLDKKDVEKFESLSYDEWYELYKKGRHPIIESDKRRRR